MARSWSPGGIISLAVCSVSASSWWLLIRPAARLKLLHAGDFPTHTMCLSLSESLFCSTSSPPPPLLHFHLVSIRSAPAVFCLSTLLGLDSFFFFSFFIRSSPASLGSITPRLLSLLFLLLLFSLLLCKRRLCLLIMIPRCLKCLAWS